MTPKTLEELDSVIRAFAQQLDRLGRRAPQTVLTVWSYLRNVLDRCQIKDDGRYDVPDHLLNDLVKTLDKQYSSRAHQWQAKHTLNLILFKLTKESVLHSKFVNVPHQVPRTLVTTLDGITPSMLAAAYHLRRIMQKTTAPEPSQDWRWGIELWSFMCFYTSVVLDSFVLLPKVHSRLLHLRREDLKERGWLKLPQHGRREEVDQGLRSLLRFPLTHSCTLHLENLLQILDLPASERIYKGPVFTDEWRTSRWHKRMGLSWIDFMAELMTNTAFSPSLFSMEILVHVATVVAMMENMPPFAVAVHTGQVSISPMTDGSFNRLFLLKGLRGTETLVRRQRPVKPRQRASTHGPDGELFQQIEQARHRLHREQADARTVRGLIAGRIFQLVEVTETELVDRAEQFTALGYNVRCYGLWLIRLLRGKDDNGTVATRASAIAAAFFPYFVGSPFCRWSELDWISNLASAMDDHETSQATASYRRFVDFLVEARLTPKPTIPWQAQAFRKSAVHYPVPLVSPQEFEAALTASSLHFIPAGIRTLLRVKMILGFDLGLRSMEATNLNLRHFIREPEPVIEIRITKTASGIRNLHLSKLMVVHHLFEIRQFVDQRYRETGGNLDAPLLATVEHPEPYDSSYLASLAGLILREVIAENLCFHHLRHSFASWFLLRWLRAVRPDLFNGVNIPIFEQQIFEEPLLSALRQLLFGLREPKIGEVAFSHGLVALCRLLGHSSPATTLSSYCHTVDVLSSLILRRGII